MVDCYELATGCATQITQIEGGALLAVSLRLTDRLQSIVREAKPHALNHVYAIRKATGFPQGKRQSRTPAIHSKRCSKVGS